MEDKIEDRSGSRHGRRGGAVTRRAGASDFGEDVGDVGLVEGRESEALLAEMVERCHYMNQRCLVDDEEAVVESEGTDW